MRCLTIRPVGSGVTVTTVNTVTTICSGWALRLNPSIGVANKPVTIGVNVRCYTISTVGSGLTVTTIATINTGWALRLNTSVGNTNKPVTVVTNVRGYTVSAISAISAGFAISSGFAISAISSVHTFRLNTGISIANKPVAVNTNVGSHTISAISSVGSGCTIATVRTICPVLALVNNNGCAIGERDSGVSRLVEPSIGNGNRGRPTTARPTANGYDGAIRKLDKSISLAISGFTHNSQRSGVCSVHTVLTIDTVLTLTNDGGGAVRERDDSITLVVELGGGYSKRVGVLTRVTRFARLTVAPLLHLDHGTVGELDEGVTLDVELIAHHGDTLTRSTRPARLYTVDAFSQIVNQLFQVGTLLGSGKRFLEHGRYERVPVVVMMVVVALVVFPGRVVLKLVIHAYSSSCSTSKTRSLGTRRPSSGSYTQSHARLPAHTQ